MTVLKNTKKQAMKPASSFIKPEWVSVYRPSSEKIEKSECGKYMFIPWKD